MSGHIQSDSTSFTSGMQGMEANVPHSSRRPNAREQNDSFNDSQSGRGSVIISGSNNIHVGSNISLGVQKQTRRVRPRTVPPDVAALFRCTTMVTDRQLMTASRYTGAAWRDVARRLGFLAGETDQFEFRVDSLREACFRMFRAWREKESSGATVEKLVKALWDEGAYDVVLKLPEASSSKEVYAAKCP
ncbi:receptor-interacting serine/threonine-protein kinase 1-like [Pollicipes pollicipes]|uniref:receptor-interacting serine/threonine-protein kinase 1-like n=1 Tax=Pollicipes pollicipes TaxID=41117 RepID=UPI0018849839|nr:receptor-interacting serine/threonine-protein kinase 1-like [Pollicipes pollicipes]XP_037085671.1 receptor-interacting serine/threonine-protein kinase 1-like [Pollicipes pollicipes]